MSLDTERDASVAPRVLVKAIRYCPCIATLLLSWTWKSGRMTGAGALSVYSTLHAVHMLIRPDQHAAAHTVKSREKSRAYKHISRFLHQALMQTRLVCKPCLYAPHLHRSQASMRDTRRSATDYQYGGSFTMHRT